MASTTLRYGYSGFVSEYVSANVSGTATAYGVYDGRTGQNESRYQIKSLGNYNIPSSVSIPYNISGSWSGTDYDTIPSDFIEATSVSGDVSYINYGTTKSGTRINPKSYSTYMSFFNAVGAGGKIYCSYSENKTISGTTTVSVSIYDLNWDPDVDDYIYTEYNDHSGQNYNVSSSGSGAVEVPVSEGFNSTSSIYLSYLTQSDLNGASVSITADQLSMDMDTTATATVTTGGATFSYYTVAWYLNDTLVYTDPTHYTTQTSVYYDGYTSTVITERNNSAKVVAVAYTTAGEADGTSESTFTVLGPVPPMKLFNIEKGGIGIGQLCTATADNPQMQVNMPAVFEQPILAPNADISGEWHQLTLASGFSAGATSSPKPGLWYRVVGTNCVSIYGNIAGTIIAPSAAKLFLSTTGGLPTQYRPKTDKEFFIKLTGWMFASLRVGADGTISLSCRKASTTVTVTSFCVTYYI